MNIMYCGDAYIENGTLMSVLSIIEHVSEPVYIYVVTAQVGTKPSVSEDFVEFLSSIVEESEHGGRVVRLDATKFFSAQPPYANMATRFTPCCMLRLYSDLIPELPGKVLYLDNDVLCRGDFSELYSMDMDGIEFAGALDYYGRFFFRRNPLHMDYMNSGVLLMNLDYMRETMLLAKCRRRCAEKRMFMPDQTSLNKLATSKKTVDRKYNEQRILREDTVFQHFSTSFRFFPYVHAVDVKPWQTDRVHEVLGLHEYDELFDRYETELGRLGQSYGNSGAFDENGIYDTPLAGQAG